MRASTFTDRRRRIGRTVGHVDGHLDDDLDVRQLADMACFSPYHFLRVFQDLTQETPLAMVRRLRLERSRLRLAAGSSVTDAADAARFERGFRQSLPFAVRHGTERRAPKRDQDRAG